jgi:hypothetical protein
MKPILLYLFIACLLTSCMSTEKATGYLANHREDAANFCAQQFPVKVTTEATAVVDSTTYLQTVADLKHYSDSVIDIAEQKNDSIDKLKALVKDLGDRGMLSAATVDVLQAQINGIHKTDVSNLRQKTTTQIVYQVKPCKDSIIVRTVENTAKSEAATLRGDRLQDEKDIMTGHRDWWRKWFFILLGIDIFYIALRWVMGKFDFAGKALGRFIK